MSSKGTCICLRLFLVFSPKFGGCHFEAKELRARRRGRALAPPNCMSGFDIRWWQELKSRNGYLLTLSRASLAYGCNRWWWNNEDKGLGDEVKEG